MTDFDERHGQLVRVAFERSYLLQNPYFRCLIFDLSFFTNADVVTIKDETSKENL